MTQSIGNSYCKISLSGKGMINVDCLVVSDFCNRSDVILGICSLKDYHFSFNFCSIKSHSKQLVTMELYVFRVLIFFPVEKLIVILQVSVL